MPILLMTTSLLWDRHHHCVTKKMQLREGSDLPNVPLIKGPLDFRTLDSRWKRHFLANSLDSTAPSRCHLSCDPPVLPLSLDPPDCDPCPQLKVSLCWSPQAQGIHSPPLGVLSHPPSSSLQIPPTQDAPPTRSPSWPCPLLS